MVFFRITLLLLGFFLTSDMVTAADPLGSVGFAKVDVTPTQPTRLSGYAVRTQSHKGVADPLSARALVLSPSDPNREKSSVVLVSVDSILVTSSLTARISGWLLERHGLPRSQLAICSTHSHAAPHLAEGLNNLFRQASTGEQQAATEAYTEQMIQAIQAAITQAFENRAPAKLAVGEGTASFAVNRRVIQQGTWRGFGEQADGPVDHRVRVLQATTPDGRLLGGAFLYACHCTTLGGDFNQISGDWAGLAASRLEILHPQTVFLPVIGCGADANPNPRGQYDFAQQHAAELLESIEGVLESPLTPLTEFPVANFGYAGVAPEMPTEQEVEELAASERSNERNWAKHMSQVRREMGRLPESYPMPIHTWQFGNQLNWVFLGGEVVVEYQLQIEKELPGAATWVAAYTDDVFAYVASESMRSEGGYEVDFSMIYYLQPGRWQSGTQARVIRRVREILNHQHVESLPLSPVEGLASVRVPQGYVVELVASEPLVQDPVNIAFGADGRVWIVEMADYPQGTQGGGRVKWLEDTDQDGRLDSAHLFLTDLSYPTSVFPWQDGVIVIAAPEIFFAADRNGDGVADFRESWLIGLAESNPQHRASGFEIGLDGWLHFGVGDGTRELTSTKNGRTYHVHGRDVAWNPNTGEIRTTSGETQFVRARDAFGHWFGNSNSRPIYQYVIEDRYLDGKTLPNGPRQDLLSPAIAPPVLPASQTMERFNDLFTLNRFTSACSSMIARVPGIAPAAGVESGAAPNVGFICEPVHNLVSRIEIEVIGSRFRGRRHPEDQEVEFWASSDPWSRPVRVINGPDGALWIVDMVRKVIEHPQWIPTSWQGQFDLRAGWELGRIYRVYRQELDPLPLPQLDDDPRTLLPALASENGVVRDLALQRILHSRQSALENDVRRIAREHTTPGVRASALGCLAAKGWLTEADLLATSRDPDPRIVRLALEWTETRGTLGEDLQHALERLPARNLGLTVDLQWILSSTRWGGVGAAQGLHTIAKRSSNDPWILNALSLVQEPRRALAAAQGLLARESLESEVVPATFVQRTACLSSLWRRIPRDDRRRLIREHWDTVTLRDETPWSASELLLLSVLAATGSSEDVEEELLKSMVAGARKQMLDSSASIEQRRALVNLIGSGLSSLEEDLKDARQMLVGNGQPALKQAVIETLRRIPADAVAGLLLDCWSELGSSQRNSASATLLSKRNWTESLVVALEDGRVQPEQLDAASVQRLRSYRDRNLRSRCLSVFGKPTPRARVVAEYLAKMPRPTVTSRSPELFQKHCAACHASRDGQSMVGPPLENLKHWTLEQWTTAILDPNRNVEPKYHQVTLLTIDDQVFAGIIQQRSDEMLQLAQSDGSIREIAVDEIETIQQTRHSLMPEGIEEKVDPRQLAELLGFLRNRSQLE